MGGCCSAAPPPPQDVHWVNAALRKSGTSRSILIPAKTVLGTQRQATLSQQLDGQCWVQEPSLEKKTSPHPDFLLSRRRQERCWSWRLLGWGGGGTIRRFVEAAVKRNHPETPARSGSPRLPFVP